MSSRVRASLVLLLPSMVLACAGEDGGPDGSAPLDAGVADAATDGGSIDAGAADAGDAGPPTYAWAGERGCSAPAWSVGVLQRVPLAELASRTFGPSDVVWLDGVPDALPDAGAVFVASSAIPEALYAAAEARHVPLVAWVGPASLELDAVVGRELLVVATAGFVAPPRTCEVRVEDVTGLLDADARAELDAARAAPGVARTRTRMLPKPTALCAIGTETTSAWALHRSQPVLSSLVPRGIWVSDATMESPHDTIDLSHRIGARRLRTQGPLASLPNARATQADGVFRDSWTVTDASGMHTVAIELPSYEALALAQLGLPVVTYGQLAARLSVTYPVAIEDPGAFGPIESETIDLWPCAWVAASGVQFRRVEIPGMGSLEYELELGGPSTRTYFTTPITRVLETRLDGLVDEEVVLEGNAGVSASADHHNFSEKLVIEPRRDPSVPTEIVEMLTARDILVLYVEVDLALSAPNTVISLHVLGRLGWRRVI
ncbi:hypothetical protein L6R52_10360 [Myxococcota bacterium]|nr:hypothetical protein [Myxococcota bacterium]